MDLSPHFTLDEFVTSQKASRLGIDNTPTPAIIDALRRTSQGLETIRTLLGVPIVVTSGYRCLMLNTAIGSKATSQHIAGQAVDFIAPRFGDPVTVISKIVNSNEIDYDQLILEYDRWVHVSFADHPRRQTLHIDATGTRPLGG